MASSQKPAETESDKDESVPENIVMRLRCPSGDTSGSSDSVSDTDSQSDTDQKKDSFSSLAV